MGEGADGTLVGSVANLIVAQRARANGTVISFREYSKGRRAAYGADHPLRQWACEAVLNRLYPAPRGRLLKFPFPSAFLSFRR